MSGHLIRAAWQSQLRVSSALHKGCWVCMSLASNTWVWRRLCVSLVSNTWVWCRICMSLASIMREVGVEHMSMASIMHEFGVEYGVWRRLCVRLASNTWVWRRLCMSLASIIPYWVNYRASWVHNFIKRGDQGGLGGGAPQRRRLLSKPFSNFQVFFSSPSNRRKLKIEDYPSPPDERRVEEVGGSGGSP